MSIYTNAQINLVPNPSFEIYDTCPNFGSQINYAKPWYGPTDNSTDYFNSCYSGVSGPGVPNNGGFQYARTGNAYAGFWSFNPGIQSYKEYLQVELLDSLKRDTCYYIEFHVNLHNNVRFGTNNLGAHLSNQAIWTTGTGFYLNLLPHIILSGNPIISDTLNWIKVNGFYLSKGGEKFITIGNFFADINTDTLSILPFPYYFGSYYFIDDVAVNGVSCNDTVIPKITSQIELPNVFTPNGDGINDVWQFSLGADVTLSGFEVYNRWGNLIKTLEINNSNYILWDGRTTSGEPCSDGVYFYVLKYTDAKGELHNKKGYISLFR